MKQIFDLGDNYKLNILEGDFLANNFKDQKFDIIVGNPPYQDPSGNKGHNLWSKFVEKSIDLLKDDGYLLNVHPSLWRQLNHPLQKLITRKNNLIYLEIHSEKDGQKTFNSSTRYDWYLLQKSKKISKTIIKGQDGKKVKMYVNNLDFIPNYNFKLIDNLTNSNSKVEVLHSESAYHHVKLSNSKTKLYKYPCVYSINRQNIPKFKYSKTNSRGHFDIPKVIFGSGHTGILLDRKGEYGLTQWCTAIVDSVKNLTSIKKCLESEKFQDIVKSISVGKSEINYKILQYFNKDFYKQFI